MKSICLSKDTMGQPKSFAQHGTFAARRKAPVERMCGETFSEL
jgi:hypothetical protein